MQGCMKDIQWNTNRDFSLSSWIQMLGKEKLTIQFSYSFSPSPYLSILSINIALDIPSNRAALV